MVDDPSSFGASKGGADVGEIAPKAKASGGTSSEGGSNPLQVPPPPAQTQPPLPPPSSPSLMSTVAAATSASSRRGGSASLPSSPATTRKPTGVSATKQISMIMPNLKKPPRNDNSHYQNQTTETSTTPLASPSSLSISSKKTVKTGFGQHMNNPQHHQHQQQPSYLNFDTNPAGPSSSTFASVAATTVRSRHVRSSSMATTKLASKTSSSSRKNTDPSMAATAARAAAQQQQQQQQQQPIFSMLDHPPLAIPRKASKCPLFSCFYAEFDNVVGPKICFESPLGFMEQSTDVPLHQIHKLLASNFDRILAENGSVHKIKENQSTTTAAAKEDQSATSEEQHNNSGTETPRGSVTPEGASSSLSPSQSLKPSRSYESAGTVPVNNTTDIASSGTHAVNNSRQRSSSTVINDNIVGGSTQHSNTSSTTSNNTDKDKDISNPSTAVAAAAAASDSTTTSIFDSTCDFIITGPELANTIVNLSAFNMHLLTRPTIIHNERYERNSLLFCVGFVLRRSEDPRPFRPLLSKLALTLKRMEMESHFLSQQSSRQQLQPLLDRMLVSLNGTHWETNLVVHNNVLNLKLFHPPRYPASPVSDHAVPILLRRDWQIQMYDWDLAINWVVLHIDGVANARQISKKAEVDMEMVRNCLRVLKHHSVISLVDMFFYSNRYESTKRAAAMLAGNEALLLQEAVDYVLKRPGGIPGVNIQATAPTPYSSLGVPLSPPTASPTFQERYVRPLTPVAAVHPGTSPGSPMSSYPSVEGAAALSSSLLGSSLKYATYASYQSQDPHLFGALRREEQRELKTALTELYSAFNRDVNFGDLWVALAAGRPRSQSVDRSAERNIKASTGQAGSEKVDATRFSHQQSGTTNRSASCTRGDSAEFTGSIGSREEDATEMTPKEHFFERLRKKSTCQTVDWETTFDNLDHRRFISFGLVNGLLQRVHNYPFLLGGSKIKQKGNYAYAYSMEDTGRLARNAALMMDGLHCDDHIVSSFQKPIGELIQMVEKAERRKVVPLYSVA